MNATRFTTGMLALVIAASVAAGQDWVEPMKKVHARFTGQAGTVAQFGDSITITMAFFNPLQADVKNLPKDLVPAHKWLVGYVQPRCWAAWKDAAHGNEGGTTSKWGRSGIDRCDSVHHRLHLCSTPLLRLIVHRGRRRGFLFW